MTPMDLRVLVLAGGLSHERDVSLRSGRRVAEALREAGCLVEVADLDADLLPRLAQGSVDVVWPLLHGASGEDGSLRDVLDVVGVPYVGSPGAACRAAWDKSVAGQVADLAGLRVPESLALPHAVFRQLGAGALLDAVLERLGLPLIVKPACGGSALGVTVVHDKEQLPRAMVDCFAYGSVALLQRLVTGTEVAVTVLDLDGGPVALPAVEVVADGGVYDYEARYTAGATEFFTPARLAEAALSACSDVALTAHRAFGLRDVSRTDIVVDAAGVPWFLEVNVAPGMTETSLLPQALEASSRTQADTYRALVDAAVSRATP
ncbi:MAG: D-alanine--D-alanine ligase [Kineosporiaceae bacterium]